jgi:8-oxo-dGTP diphosphatase
MTEEVARIYGNKVRVRACGLCWHDNQLLMINHRSITNNDFWAPPGGGVDFGKSLSDTLKKEFWEEANLHITPGKFVFGCEFIQHPIHAIELFYDVAIQSGTLKTGYDPEIQIIEEARFLTEKEIWQIPKNERHGIFGIAETLHDLQNLSGFFRV